MKVSDFSIGLIFYMSGSKWKCTDVGTRTIAAIKMDPKLDPSWFKGPPYAVVEYCLDEVCDLSGCNIKE